MASMEMNRFSEEVFAPDISRVHLEALKFLDRRMPALQISMLEVNSSTRQCPMKIHSHAGVVERSVKKIHLPQGFYDVELHMNPHLDIGTG